MPYLLRLKVKRLIDVKCENRSNTAMVQDYYSSSDDISMSEHSDSDISPCINLAGWQSSLLVASNSDKGQSLPKGS